MYELTVERGQAVAWLVAVGQVETLERAEAVEWEDVGRAEAVEWEGVGQASS